MNRHVLSPAVTCTVNGRKTELKSAPHERLSTVLRTELGLTGTKVGCDAGDCGACTVLVGRLAGGQLVYETVNACIRFVASLDACHVVTVEHLRGADGGLHPVQQAMVDLHGSQCGFCTPGIVMSLYALWMNSPSPAVADIERALQGNLCRCTGYEPIIRASLAAASAGGQAADVLVAERSKVTAMLEDLRDGCRIEGGKEGDKFIVPATADDLAEIRLQHPDAVIVAGATDVCLWVNKHMRSISPAIFISGLDELHRIEEAEDGLRVGACVTYTELQDVIAKRYPQMAGYWNRIGGEQVRNMGTIGGNVANGSPIGDTLPLLIALGASVALRRGNDLRTVKLEDFFIDYGKQAREPGDFVESLHIPALKDSDLFAAYKVSKRRHEDISSVAAAFRVSLKAGVVEEAVCAYGGMAATPRRAGTVEGLLLGRHWNEQTVREALAGYDADFSPISDWRASAEYRALVARRLLQRFFLETAPEADLAALRGEGRVA